MTRDCAEETQANNLKERKCCMSKRECWFRDSDKTRRKCGTNYIEGEGKDDGMNIFIRAL